METLPVEGFPMIHARQAELFAGDGRDSARWAVDALLKGIVDSSCGLRADGRAPASGAE